MLDHKPRGDWDTDLVPGQPDWYGSVAVFGRTPTPVGPMTQGYGSANPWSWDRFPEPTS